MRSSPVSSRSCDEAATSRLFEVRPEETAPDVRPQPTVTPDTVVPPDPVPAQESSAPAHRLPSFGRPPATLAQRIQSSVRMFVVAGVLYSLFFHLSVVRGSSMAPGIRDGDRILVEPWSYLIDDVSCGDVVVMRYPLDPTVDYIKRIIGLPGDQVTLADGHVWVNGDLLSEPYVRDVDPSTYLSSVVDEGHYFVLGDNRPRSSDSREFGLVPAEYLRGRVDLRLWPISRAGWVE